MKINMVNYGRGVPLVFFHGWGFDSHIWMPLIPQLIGHYQIILVDLPGFGLSSMMDWDVFKEKLLRQLPQQFALLGWSMGGLHAMRLAMEAPDRVTSLINITSSPHFILDDLWPGVAKELFIEFHNKLANNAHDTLNEFINLQINKNKVQVIRGHPPSPEGLEAGLQILSKWDLREELKNFDRPACFMFGRLDPIVPVNTMKTMQIIYPHFNYVLFNRAAHMPFLSHSDLFIEKLREFSK